VHRTLNHLLLTDRAWLGRFTGDPDLSQSLDENGEPIRARGLDHELYAEFATLRRERERTDAHIDVWTASLTEQRLAGRIIYKSIMGERYEHPLWWAVSHFFNHQTHHRGQVTTLLMQLGRDAGVTDLLILLRDHPQL